MTEKVSVSGPVTIQSDSASRVALDLMQHIAAWETVQDAEKRTRDYWVKLYCQCHEAARGISASHVLGK